jgi:NodT family efflux transporter outer membrane factor (OMF) lipoprotein
MMQDAPPTLSVTRAVRAAASLRYAFVLTTFFAAGCAVGPDFKAPEAPTTSQYVAHDEKMETAIEAGPGAPKQTLQVGERVQRDWWTLFQSPDLDSVVKQAIAGNRTLDSARARLVEARESVKAASSAFYPEVSVSAGASREKLNAAGFGLTPSEVPILPPNFNFFQVGATASYSLDIFGGTRRKVEQQEALAAFAAEQVHAAYLTLTGNAVSAAVQIAAIRAQTEALTQILDIDKQNVELVRTEREAGAVPDSDVITAESQLASDKTLQPALDQQMSVAKHALAVLLGKSPGEWSPPEFNLNALAIPGELPVTLPSELVHQRPDILAAEAQLHAASAQIGIATAQLYPSITLSGSAGGAALQGGGLFDPAALVWSIAAGITQPVFDGGRRRADRRAALAAFRGSAADYQQTVLQAFGQVADILKALEHDGNLLAAQQTALDMAAQSVRLQRISYSGGGTGLLSLLDAQRQYQQALVGHVRAQTQRYQDSIELFVAMGGGWWNEGATTASGHAEPDREKGGS